MKRLVWLIILLFAFGCIHSPWVKKDEEPTAEDYMERAEETGAAWSSYTDQATTAVGDTFLFRDIDDAEAAKINEITAAQLATDLAGKISAGDLADDSIVDADIDQDGTFSLTGGWTMATVDATTNFTIDGLVLTADTITNDAALTVVAPTITLDADGTNDMDVVLKVDDGGIDWSVTVDGSEGTVVIGDGDDFDYVIKVDSDAGDYTQTWMVDEEELRLASSTGEDLTIDLNTAVDNQISLSSQTGVTEIATALNVEVTGDLAGGVPTASKSANYTIGTDDSNECYGGVIYVTSTCDITACDNLAAGMSFTVITIGATQVDVDVQADDRMYLDGTLLENGDKAVNTSTTGDSIVCTYYSADGWYCMSGSPDGDNWTDGN